MRRSLNVALVLIAGSAWTASLAQETNSVLAPPKLAHSSPSGESCVTVMISPDGTILLRHGGQESPFVSIKADEIDARLLENRDVILQPQFGVPEHKLQYVTDKLRTAGATRIELQPATPRSVNGAYQHHEQRAMQLASQLRALGTDDSKSKQRDELQSNLRREVVTAFEIRQQQQRNEVSRLRNRLGEIEQSITARERLKPEIINSRIAELVDPNRQWAPAATNPTAMTPVPATVAPAVAPIVPVPTETPPRSSKSPLPVATDPFAAPPSTAIRGDGNFLILRSADEFRHKLADATSDLHAVQGNTFSLGVLEDRQRRLNAILAEYTAQLKLLELEIQSANLSLEKARGELANTEKLHAKQVVSKAELDLAKLPVAQAKLRLEQLNTLYELYRSVGQKEDRKPQPAALPGLPPAGPGGGPADANAKPMSQIDWLNDLDRAKQVSAARDRPILIYFTAPWAHWATSLEKEVFAHQDVADLIRSRYVPLRLDYDSHKSLAKEFGAKGVPWHVILLTDGRPLAEFNPPQKPAAYLGYLKGLMKGLDVGASEAPNDRPPQNK